MYAVIRTGGKQYKVEAGERLEVERLGVDDGTDVELTPVLLVDGDNVLATPAQLAGATVQARVIGATRGPKIDGFIYKPKSNNRRRYGHRQDLSVIEITGIGPAKKPRSRAKAKPAEAAEPEPAESAAVESEES
jgi:large subunit ribosomal protein L21